MQKKATVVLSPSMTLADVAKLLRDLSSDRHEATLEAYSTPSGLVCAQVRWIDVQNLPPEFIRLQALKET